MIARLVGVTTPRPRAGFTLVEMLVVVAIIVALVAMMMPAINRAIATAEAVQCASNLRQQQVAIMSYTADHRGIFPDHRRDNFGAGSRPDGYDRYWASTLLDYGMTPEGFRCPSIGSPQIDRGLNWHWKFDQHFIGYGYNGFFLGLRLYGDQSQHGIASTGHFRMSRVKNPAMNLCIADSAPRASGIWSQSVWWPNSAMTNDEGVRDNRHEAGAAIVFNDEHANFFLADDINPPYTGSHQFLEFWDPLQRN